MSLIKVPLIPQEPDPYMKGVEVNMALVKLGHLKYVIDQINTAFTTVSGVQSVTGLNTNNTDPYNPVVSISVDGTSITGDGTPGNPLVATGGSGIVYPNHQIVYGNGVAGGTADTNLTWNSTTYAFSATDGSANGISSNPTTGAFQAKLTDSVSYSLLLSMNAPHLLDFTNVFSMDDLTNGYSVALEFRSDVMFLIWTDNNLIYSNISLTATTVAMVYQGAVGLAAVLLTDASTELTFNANNPGTVSRLHLGDLVANLSATDTLISSSIDLNLSSIDISYNDSNTGRSSNMSLEDQLITISFGGGNGTKIQMDDSTKGIEVIAGSATLGLDGTKNTPYVIGMTPYANNAAAVAALGANRLYYTDVAGEWFVKIAH